MEKELPVNELELLISEAYKSSDPTLLHYVINIVYSKIDLRYSSLKKIDIEKLNKVSHKAEKLETLFCVGLIYNIIFSYKLIDVAVLTPENILTIVNILYPVCEKLNGTILVNRIIGRIKNLLILLMKRNDIGEEDKITINNLLESPNLAQDKIYTNFEEYNEVKEIRKMCKSKNLFDKISGLMKLMDFFSSCSSLEEQLEVFSKKALSLFKLAVGDPGEKSKELLLMMGAFLDTMLFQADFLVKINKDVFQPGIKFEDQKDFFLKFDTEVRGKTLDTTELINSINQELKEKPSNDINLPYRLYEQERILRQCDGIYATVAFIVNTFLLFPKIIEIQKLSLVILQRLYYLFPRFRKHLEEPILTIFSNIHEDTFEVNKKEASVFLYKLIHRDANPEFKSLIESKETFRTLYTTSFYDPNVLVNEKNEIEALELHELNLKPGFSLNVQVPAGEINSQVLEVWQPYSILIWSLATVQYDINFSLTRVACFSNVLNKREDPAAIYIQSKKIEASKMAFRGYLVVPEPGLYKIEFDNSFSWFNSKSVRFRYLVLEPDFSVEGLIGGSDKNWIKNVILPSKVFDPNGVPVEESKAASSSSPNNVSESNLLNAYSKDNVTSNDIMCIVHFRSSCVEFSIAGPDRAYELAIHYENEKIDWSKINDRLSEIVNKTIDGIKGSQKVNLRILYNEKAYEKLRSEGNQVNPNEYYIKNLNFISKIQTHLTIQAKAIPEMEYVVDKLALDKLFQTFKHLFIICINYECNKIYGKLAKDINNKFPAKLNLDGMSVPVLDGDKFLMTSVSEAFFSREKEEDKLVILGSVISNVHLMFDRNTYNFAIFENEPRLLSTEARAKELNNIIDVYIEKSGKPINKEDPDARPLNIIVAKLDLKEYIKS